MFKTTNKTMTHLLYIHGSSRWSDALHRYVLPIKEVVGIEVAVNLRKGSWRGKINFENLAVHSFLLGAKEWVSVTLFYHRLPGFTAGNKHA